MTPRVKLRLLDGAYGVARLHADASIPAWVDGDHLLVKSKDLEKARELLANAGHSLV
ncbi:hypothetical protein G6L67_03715 [Agrobacterium tumefaciens]|jgi:hypothetical protein|uniref:A9CJY8-like N-terminal domain-containing protein n=1 Tax=Agrobacterium tumefaciens str. Kerr 14 TaxID=1183424 RepID=A0A1S7Q0D0_AGRTU|nr:hypothetical protein [Agrobacterium tumefaciens]AYM80253.1 hypothetical protein At12D1_03660 [Agrobacterium tumefaciens]NTE90953.1 hypothetical protein [Agrobacterium tumefaciens]CUX29356.1 hypothetical protein AGR4C_Cc50278 [Agrobacterium tumefaciens str. Kerr 14]